MKTLHTASWGHHTGAQDVAITCNQTTSYTIASMLYKSKEPWNEAKTFVLFTLMTKKQMLRTCKTLLA